MNAETGKAGVGEAVIGALMNAGWAEEDEHAARMADVVLRAVTNSRAGLWAELRRAIENVHVVETPAERSLLAALLRDLVNELQLPTATCSACGAVEVSEHGDDQRYLCARCL